MKVKLKIDANGVRSLALDPTTAANATDANYEAIASAVFNRSFEQSVVRIDDDLPLNEYTIVRFTAHAPALVWRNTIYAPPTRFDAAPPPKIAACPHYWRWGQFLDTGDTLASPASPVGVWVFNNTIDRVAAGTPVLAALDFYVNYLLVEMCKLYRAAVGNNTREVYFIGYWRLWKVLEKKPLTDQANFVILFLSASAAAIASSSADANAQAMMLYHWTYALCVHSDQADLANDAALCAQRKAIEFFDLALARKPAWQFDGRLDEILAAAVRVIEAQQ